MERKTIGSLIAALRKANGMTQKELAEQLNVSDKTVSRWERDEGAPDISMIVVIAELFHVTCDELLRGQRKPMEERTGSSCETEMTPKGEKQYRHLLAVSLTRYRNRSFIAMGILLAGLLAAMIGNFGFLRAYIGFFAGVVLDLAAVICQLIFVSNAFLSVGDNSLGCTGANRFRTSVIRLAYGVMGMAAVLFGFTLPLVTMPGDAYAGLTADAWFRSGIAYAGAALIIYIIVCLAVHRILLKKGIYALTEREEECRLRNRPLRRRCLLVLTAAAAVTLVGQLFVNEVLGAEAFCQTIEFRDYDSFAAFMEQEVPIGYEDGMAIVAEVPIDDEPIQYYDEAGNPISEEEALKETLTDSEGNVLCEYLCRNESVAVVSYNEKAETLLPITVITREAYRAAKAGLKMINGVFAALYGAELLGALLVYNRKRSR